MRRRVITGTQAVAARASSGVGVNGTSTHRISIRTVSSSSNSVISNANTPMSTNTNTPKSKNSGKQSPDSSTGQTSVNLAGTDNVNSLKPDRPPTTASILSIYRNTPNSLTGNILTGGCNRAPSPQISTTTSASSTPQQQPTVPHGHSLLMTSVQSTLQQNPNSMTCESDKSSKEHPHATSHPPRDAAAANLNLSNKKIKPNQPTAANQGKIPFQHRAFSDFVCLVGRLFYDDACIVMMDFLVREQRAFTEAEIRERLKWKDTMVHQKLYFLERQLLVQREQDQMKGSKSPSYWRINPYIVLVVKWHVNKLFDEISKQLELSRSLQEFECTVCQSKYSALDAASGVGALDDDHPLCRKCGNRLTISNSQEAKSEALDKKGRCEQQLLGMQRSLERVSNMEIPVFEKYTKADKNESRRELEQSTGSAAGQITISGNVSVSPSVTTMVNSLPESLGSSLTSLSKEPAAMDNRAKIPQPVSPTGSAVSAPSPISQTAQRSRVIPWFSKEGTAASMHMLPLPPLQKLTAADLFKNATNPPTGPQPGANKAVLQYVPTVAGKRRELMP